MDSRGGLVPGEIEAATVESGLVHSSLTVLRSSFPRVLEAGREDLIKEGAWISA